MASAGPYANNLHLAPDNHTNSPSLDLYRSDALPDAQQTASKHGMHTKKISNILTAPKQKLTCSMKKVL